MHRDELSSYMEIITDYNELRYFLHGVGIRPVSTFLLLPLALAYYRLSKVYQINEIF